MSRIQLSNHLFLDEYIPESLYRQYEKRPHILVGLIDRWLVDADRKLREQFGPVTINNWWHGGDRQWSGLRVPGSPYYSPTSQHSFGRASDKLFANAPAEEVRKYIQANWRQLGITCIEAGVSWVHSDLRWTHTNELLIVRP